MKLRHIVLLLVFSLGISAIACGQEITVAAAADLNAALTELTGQYSAASGVAVKVSFGASGNLFNQIQNGAPFDLFFSADEEYPKQLIEKGLGEKDSRYRYAAGRIVLWVPADSKLDIEGKGLQALLNPAVKKVAIANPQHAPYGRAAAAALRHAGVYDQIQDRLVLGENVSQAAQFVESGNAQAGIVALSHALAPAMKGKGRYWEVPLDFYPPLNQSAIVISRSQQKTRAAQFLEYLRKPEAIAVLRKYGFTVPDAEPR